MVRKAKTTQKRQPINNSKDTPSPRVSRRVSGRASTARQNGGRHQEDEAESSVGKSSEESDAYIQDDSDDLVSLNSDTLDDPDFDTSGKGKKRKRGPHARSSPSKKSREATKSPRKKAIREPAIEEEDCEDGQEIVGTVVQAPRTGRVPPGQISKNTLDFLKQLQDPKCNDRTWFKLHEPVYRLAEKEWKDFIDEFTALLMEADPQIPPLPPNDVVHRIYRDIRFSNDKTPYKTNLSASFSRSGRKGIFAGYHLMIKPGSSAFFAGSWCPGKNELQTIRNNILRSSRPLREIVSNPEFVNVYGEPKPNPKGKWQNIFGHEDELKVAPKGMDKNHRDIDLLKCRSFAVKHEFTDKEVLDPNFKEELKRIVVVTRPFVYCLNDYMTIPPEENEQSASGSDGGSDEWHVSS